MEPNLVKPVQQPTPETQREIKPARPAEDPSLMKERNPEKGLWSPYKQTESMTPPLSEDDILQPDD